MGAALAIICGLMLWSLSLGEPWIRTSYDSLFRFTARTVTNQVIVILMDNEAYAELGQSREQPWDRALHVKLLNRLADDGCPLVVFDVFLRRQGDPVVDQTLATAMTRLGNVVLVAEQASVAHPGLESVRPTLPLETFLIAARTNWGVAWLDPDDDFIVRRHWPFPNPAPYASLPWTAAELAGARLSDVPHERWLRYYQTDKTWITLSYHLALAKGPGYFTGKTVFIGTQPRTPLPDNERDEFRSPHFGWTKETVGGVEILATSFLNLLNDDWLRRPAWPVEVLVFVLAGGLLGGSLCRLQRGWALGISGGAALLVVVGAVYLSYFTNYWFPWLIIVGGQLPCALAWGLVVVKLPDIQPVELNKPAPDKTIRLSFPEQQLPDAPEYEVITPEIGKGGFGKVWIARNAIGQWQALKAVYESSFKGNRGPYEAEFKGLQRYKPVSEKHPGLLRIDLVSKMKTEGYFYYVMELGDAQAPGWEKQPKLYKPKDLENMRKQAYGRRIQPKECLHIVTVLADALNFLHQQGLTHRDIKPSNVIFVNGRPKLADIGLVADIRPVDQVHTLVGTFGYMPPPPEKPGTPQADIYALGMLLYVISTGRDPGFFPDISTTLMERSGHAEFVQLDAIIIKACQPNLVERYRKTSEMLRDLQKVS